MSSSRPAEHFPARRVDPLCILEVHQHWKGPRQDFDLRDERLHGSVRALLRRQFDRWVASIVRQRQHLTKDPPDTLYIGALAAPNTVNTMPEETLLAFADHGEVEGVLPRDGGDAAETLSAISKAGVDLAKLAADLQAAGAKSFDESWSDLLKSIETKSLALVA